MSLNRHFLPFMYSSCLLLLYGILAMNAKTCHAETTKVYIVYLGERPEHITNLETTHSSLLQRAISLSEDEGSKRLMRCYTKSFNGFASILSEEEANILSSMDEVVSVFPSKRRPLSTTRSWNFLGFPLGAPRATFESDVIIGVMDTGIWPESKIFDDSGFGPPPNKWKGVCDSNHNFTCNNKIIGARYYHFNKTIDIGAGEIPSPRDSDGHGTHTSSIAAGIDVPHVSYSGLAEGTARGGVPSARIAVYKVCWKGGCSDADLLSGFDDAIADGVDIISISIGGDDGLDYFKDSIAIGSFHAMKKNILTSAGAGNSGPNSSTVANYAPWMLTVAASTIDRKLVSQTQLGDGREYQGLAINTFGLNDVMYPIIYGGDAPNISAGVSSSNSSTCALGSLDGELVKGKVVLCSEVRGGLGPKLAGAVGAIMREVLPKDGARAYALPVTVLGSNDSTHVLNYVKKSSNPTASISKSRGVFDPEAPYVAHFSSRGPNPVTSNVLKPDLAAPGVDIIAGNSPRQSQGNDYRILSGTSMACPHASGAAAYVKSFNPTWSPAAIKSALMTTAHVMNPTKNVDAEFSYGAGQLNPLVAAKPGLVYDVDEKDYVKMLCSEGYTTKNLRTVTGDNSTCTSVTNGTVLGLNYPSAALLVKHGKSFSHSFQRTVTNVGKSNSIYKSTVSAPASIKISVEPDIINFKALLEKKSFVVKIEGDTEKPILSASLIWSDGVHNVRSPIVVYTKKE